MNDIIFQASDLASPKRVDFIRAAQHGGARLRDKDGTSLLFLPESEVALLRGLAHWSRQYLNLNELIASGAELSVGTLGDLAWLRYLDREDVCVFSIELHDALVVSLADGQLDLITECVRAWRITANEMADPQRRAALTAGFSLTDYADALEPLESAG